MDPGFSMRRWGFAAIMGAGLYLWSAPASAQKLIFSPTCGVAGSKVCVTGSGWAEPQPVCYYRFYFNNVVAAPDQPFLDIPLTGNTLAGGASTQVTLEFSNPDSEAIRPGTKVLAGAGAR